jgi:putative transposase
VYAALGIEKLRIEKRQAWQNLIESHFNIVRKMADAKFARATSWEEIIAIHRKWMRDYNVQRHWAHEKREDGCHSPIKVLAWHKGTVYPTEFLDRILFATRYTRHLDKHGFLRFQNWKLYGERGLAQAPVTVWVYDGSLRVEYQAVTLSQYKVDLQEDRKHLSQVSHPRLANTPFRSPQLALFEPSSGRVAPLLENPGASPCSPETACCRYGSTAVVRSRTNRSGCWRGFEQGCSISAYPYSPS